MSPDMYASAVNGIDGSCRPRLSWCPWCGWSRSSPFHTRMSELFATPPQVGKDDGMAIVVRVTRNGPYRVEGAESITRRRRVMSEHGEPMTWQMTSEIDVPERVSLCRCGRSERKPFCDGEHAKVGFGGTERAPEEPRAERVKDYGEGAITVHDDRSLCVHAGFCGNRVTNVWKLARGGDTDDSIARMQAMSMIERCPSGALTYSLDGEEGDVEPPLGEAIAIVDDGPIFVSGGVSVERTDGSTLEARNRVTLCRCGKSDSKPLCDGSHVEAGFQDS